MTGTVEGRLRDYRRRSAFAAGEAVRVALTPDLAVGDQVDGCSAPRIADGQEGRVVLRLFLPLSATRQISFGPAAWRKARAELRDGRLANRAGDSSQRPSCGAGR